MLRLRLPAWNSALKTMHYTCSTVSNITFILIWFIHSCTVASDYPSPDCCQLLTLKHTWRRGWEGMNFPSREVLTDKTQAVVHFFIGKLQFWCITTHTCTVATYTFYSNIANYFIYTSVGTPDIAKDITARQILYRGDRRCRQIWANLLPRILADWPASSLIFFVARSWCFKLRRSCNLS